MSENPKAIYERALSVTSFLGGITFAGLILLLQSSRKFTLSGTSSLLNMIYLQTLITGMAIVSLVFVAASIILIKPAGGDVLMAKRASALTYLENGAYVGLMILIPLLLLPFTVVGVIAIILVEAAIAKIVFFD